jgi:methylenetetrahydrofolate--tRNA-(uracil-5-)-methyltransferase
MEGYMGNVASGLVAGINLARKLAGKSEWVAPKTSMLGALSHYITHAEPKEFQPMKANFGIIPELEKPIRNRRERKQHYSQRAITAMQESIVAMNDPYLEDVALPELHFT